MSERLLRFADEEPAVPLRELLARCARRALAAAVVFLATCMLPDLVRGEVVLGKFPLACTCTGVLVGMVLFLEGTIARRRWGWRVFAVLLGVPVVLLGLDLQLYELAFLVETRDPTLALAGTRDVLVELLRSVEDGMPLGKRWVATTCAYAASLAVLVVARASGVPRRVPVLYVPLVHVVVIAAFQPFERWGWGTRLPITDALSILEEPRLLLVLAVLPLVLPRVGAVAPARPRTRLVGVREEHELRSSDPLSLGPLEGASGSPCVRRFNVRAPSGTRSGSRGRGLIPSTRGCSGRSSSR